MFDSFEDCEICHQKVTDRILKAQGKVYHPGCLSCTSCDRNLDSVPFTVDLSNNIHCVECYQL